MSSGSRSSGRCFSADGRLAAAESDTDIERGRYVDHERDLVLDAEFGVELPIERERVEFIDRDEVRETVGARVTGTREAFDQRVLVPVLSPDRVQSLRYRGS